MDSLFRILERAFWIFFLVHLSLILKAVAYSFFTCSITEFRLEPELTDSVTSTVDLSLLLINSSRPILRPFLPRKAMRVYYSFACMQARPKEYLFNKPYKQSLEERRHASGQTSCNDFFKSFHMVRQGTNRVSEHSYEPF